MSDDGEGTTCSRGSSSVLPAINIEVVLNCSATFSLQEGRQRSLNLWCPRRKWRAEWFEGGWMTNGGAELNLPFTLLINHRVHDGGDQSCFGESREEVLSSSESCHPLVPSGFWWWMWKFLYLLVCADDLQHELIVLTCLRSSSFQLFFIATVLLTFRLEGFLQCSETLRPVLKSTMYLLHSASH